MNSIISQMINKHNPQTQEEHINALKEVVQEITLYGLSKTNFFDKAAFYGGTALRIFYGLDRFSEDLDFSLLEPNADFEISIYLDSLDKTFKEFGLEFSTSLKQKTKETNIQSAFIKGNTLEHILLISPNNDLSSNIQKGASIKIKFEIDILPPASATYEYKYSLLPFPYKVKLYDKASLFAGKIHAVLCRAWKARIKGRDLYDYVFYMQNDTSLNIKHLQKRLEQTGNWDKKEILTLEKLKLMLNEKFKEIDYEEAKRDVVRFIKNKNVLDVWDKDFFIFITENLKILNE